MFNYTQQRVLLRLEASEWQGICPAELDGHPARDIGSNGRIPLRVVTFNGNMAFFINGTKVWQGTDTLPAGCSNRARPVVMPYVAYWSDYNDYWYIDSVSTSNPLGPAALEESEISAEQLAPNEAANKTMAGSPAGPNMGMEEYQFRAGHAGRYGIDVLRAKTGSVPGARAEDLP